MRRARVEAVLICTLALLPFVPMLVHGELPSFRDHRDYFVPLREFTADSIRSLELPLWNPFNASGEPWLANPQTGVFYPPAWFMIVLPFRVGYALFLSFHLAVLGIGFWLLMRRWTSSLAAMTGALCLMSSGPVLSLLDVSNNLATLAWLPWALLFALDRARATFTRDALPLTLGFLGGEPMLAVVAAVAYSIVRLLREKRAALASVALTGLLTIALSGAQLAPFVASLAGSERAAGLDAGSAMKQSLAPVDWLGTVLTNAGSGGLIVRPARSQTFLASLYVAPFMVFMAGLFVAFAVTRSGSIPRRLALGLPVAFAASAILAAGRFLGPAAAVYEALHLTVNRYPAKFALVGVVALVAAGTIALDRAAEADVRQRLLSLGISAAIVLGGGVLLRPSPLAIMFCIAWLGLAAVWIGTAARRPGPLFASFVLATALAGDSYVASKFLFETSPHERTVAPYDAMLDHSRKVIRLEQFDGKMPGVMPELDRQAWLGGYLNLGQRQFDASTAAPVVSRRYAALHDCALSERRLDILDWLSVGYLLTAREIDEAGFTKVGRCRGVNVFARTTALPMLTVWESVKPVPSDDAAVERLIGTPGIATGAISVTGAVPPLPPNASAGPVGKSYIAEIGLNEVSGLVESPRGGIAVLNQVDDGGWRVSVDGAASRSLRVNGLFRGVAVTPGRHEIVWSYRPVAFVVGIMMSIAGIVACAIDLSLRAGSLRRN